LAIGGVHVGPPELVLVLLEVLVLVLLEAFVPLEALMPLDALVPPVPLAQPWQAPRPDPSALQTCAPCPPPAHAQATWAPGTQTVPPAPVPEPPPAPKGTAPPPLHAASARPPKNAIQRPRPATRRVVLKLLYLCLEVSVPADLMGERGRSPLCR